MIFTKLARNVCWICGAAENLTGEHKIKKSDLTKNATGKPAVWRSFRGEEKPIQGLNSRLLKFERSICSTCNNQTTQAADRAYDQFHNTQSKLMKQKLNDDNNPIDVALEDQTELSRYFAKHLGCAVSYSRFPVPRRLSNLVNRKSKNVCISLQVRSAPFVWKDDKTGEVGQINAIGGIVLIHRKNPISLPMEYQTAFMVGGLQFIITMKLNALEAMEVRTIYRRHMGISRKNISDERAKFLGLPHKD